MSQAYNVDILQELIVVSAMKRTGLHYIVGINGKGFDKQEEGTHVDDTVIALRKVAVTVASDFVVAMPKRNNYNK